MVDKLTTNILTKPQVQRRIKKVINKLSDEILGNKVKWTMDDLCGLIQAFKDWPKLKKRMTMSDIARQRARQISGELANILTNEIFGDYGTDWSWDELCEFITKLKTLAKARGEPVKIEKDRIQCEFCKKWIKPDPDYEKRIAKAESETGNISPSICTSCAVKVMEINQKSERQLTPRRGICEKCANAKCRENHIGYFFGAVLPCFEPVDKETIKACSGLLGSEMIDHIVKYHDGLFDLIIKETNETNPDT